ncbi:ABC transporter permease [Aureibaculum sp. A20]|uniref:ABC transporter permease n=1 Tax=Aureibaculum flavum TaxID=2795986 RepID=A0ABS0WM98_9FLAO|nr:ABC transporter permease [Aureibaculum flavum]MBJ2173102.1 ABC transporter permease [Aureibaculum flavum]
MLKNYIKIAWRNLKTNRMFSIINILGLALGLSITILLFLSITYERSYNTMYTHKDQIYRVLVNTGESYDKQILCTAPAALTPAIKNDMPDVKYAARILKHGFGETAFVKVGNTTFLEKELYWCDPELFEIFNVKFLQGEASSAITRPNTITISKSTAKKYFGEADPMGKIIVVDSDEKLEVTGVFEDFPENSSLHCNAIASFSSTFAYQNPSWGNSSFETYLQLNENTSQANTESQLQSLLDKNVDKEGQWFHFTLQPLEKVHLYSADYSNSYSKRVGDIDEINNLSFLGILILLIACVNYMNLMTAKSAKRSKDVGINKTLGASFKSLIVRFYAETGIITLIALVIGVFISVLFIPLFNQLTAQQLEVSLLFKPQVLLGILLFWVIATLVSGSYPAFYLSSISPNSALTSTRKDGSSIINVRKGLVVLQFAASIILIVGVLVIYQQLQFMQNQKLGFDSDNVVAISTTAVNGNDKKEALVQEYESLSMVSDIAMAQGFPGVTVSGRMLFKTENDESGLKIQTNRADAEIIDLLKLKLIAGKTLPLVKQQGDTISEVVLNKKALDYLGYTPEESIGKKVLIQGFSGDVFIVGIVDDFNFESLHQPIGAYAFHNRRTEAQNFALVRFNSNSLTNTMDQLESKFLKINPDSSFEYTFLDKNIEQLYAQERKTAILGFTFSILAIFVACLGLFGLAAFTAEQRKKEIGIRKVLGATIMGITQMLSMDFLKLVVVAIVIAFPIAYWLMHKWLQNFAYRIDFSWYIFAISGILAIVIALITVSFQAVKAALSNPVKSLRTE